MLARHRFPHDSSSSRSSHRQQEAQRPTKFAQNFRKQFLIISIEQVTRLELLAEVVANPGHVGVPVSNLKLLGGAIAGLPLVFAVD